MSKPYRTCPDCGCNLDHGEICDCKKGEPKEAAAEAGQTAGELATPTRNRPEPALMLMPGARYETCRECGLEWNVSKQAVIPWYGYTCPRCRGKRREAQSRENSQNKDAGGRGRGLRDNAATPK